MESDILLPCSQKPSTCPLLWARSNQSKASSYFSNIGLILSSHLTPIPSEPSHSFTFTHENSACIQYLPHTCHMSHSPWLAQPNSIWWEEHIIMQLSPHEKQKTLYRRAQNTSCNPKFLSFNTRYPSHQHRPLILTLAERWVVLRTYRTDCRPRDLASVSLQEGSPCDMLALFQVRVACSYTTRM